MIGCEIDHPRFVLTVPSAEKWPTTADSSRPETISYMQRHGFKRIQRAIKGARSLEEGVEFLKSFDIVVHPRCVSYHRRTDVLPTRLIPNRASRVANPWKTAIIMSSALRYAYEGAPDYESGASGAVPELTTLSNPEGRSSRAYAGMYGGVRLMAPKMTGGADCASR